MSIGVCYFPEHWPGERWGRDVERMAAAGIEFVRMGEFAWNRMEPEPGEYDFEWLAEAVELVGEHGMRAVLCTPTATPPKWLLDERPDVRQERPDGTPLEVRQSPTLLLQLAGVPAGEPAHRRATGRAVRGRRPRRRLADRQRVRLPRHRPVLLRRLHVGVSRLAPRAVRDGRGAQRGVE